MEIFSGILGVIALILLFVLSIVWIILPFAVFGIKDTLEKALKELQKINQTLTEAQYEMRKRNQNPKAGAADKNDSSFDAQPGA